MSKGTPSFGKRSTGKTHGICRRCGSSSFNLAGGYCTSCSFGKKRRMAKRAWKK